MKVEFVDTKAAVARMLDQLPDLSGLPPSLYIDLEGNNLSRHGSISLLTLLSQPRDTTYLLDVKELGSEAFTTSGSRGLSMKNVLESATTIKVFFDVRNDSDALFGHFQIQLAGIHDLQLMELASRSFSRRHVNGLAKCIENDSGLNHKQKSDWRSVKETGSRRFDPKRGGSYAVFDVRPLTEDILSYCVQDVSFLPILWHVYKRKLTDSWWGKIEEETGARIQLSQDHSFNGKGQHMALGPSKWTKRQPSPHYHRPLTSPDTSVEATITAPTIDMSPKVLNTKLSSRQSECHDEHDNSTQRLNLTSSFRSSHQAPIQNILKDLASLKFGDDADGLSLREPDEVNYRICKQYPHAEGHDPEANNRDNAPWGHNDDDDDDDSDADFVACSADSCGYCGRCVY